MFKRLVAGALALILLGSCADMEKKDLGTAAGAILGGILGSNVGSGQGRTAATILGAVAGGMLGRQYGAYLDEQDRKRIAEHTLRSLDDGNRAVYVSPKSGAVVTMTPSAPSYEAKLEIPVALGVDTSKPLTLEYATYQTTCAAEVKASPTITSNTLQTFPKDESIAVAASVRDSDWLLATQGGIAVGYINKRDILPQTCVVSKPVSVVAKAETIGKKPPKPKQKSAVVAKAQKPSESEPAPTVSPKTDQASVAAATTSPQSPVPAANTPADTANPVAVDSRTLTKVALQTQCKVVTRTIQVPNGGPTGKEDLKFCSEPPQGWKQVAV